jgi:hypothetical protein
MAGVHLDAIFFQTKLPIALCQKMMPLHQQKSQKGSIPAHLSNIDKVDLHESAKIRRTYLFGRQVGNPHNTLSGTWLKLLPK